MEKKFLTRDKIVGKQVVDANGVTIGTIKEITFDLSGARMAITVADAEGKETDVSSDDVSAVGDIVLLKKPQPATPAETPAKPTGPAAPARAAAPAPPTAKTAPSSGLCPNCGFQNEADSRFCIKCGTKLK